MPLLAFFRKNFLKIFLTLKSRIFGKEKQILIVKFTERTLTHMKRFENLDSLLAGSETAKIFFASLPDYVQGAALRNSTKILTEDELHRFAEKTMHEFH